MSALTDLAKGKPCMIRLPGICSGNDEQTVPCHLPLMDFHGVALKTGDVFVAWGCRPCHDAVDRRGTHRAIHDRMRLAHYDGMYRTLSYIIEYHPQALIDYIEETSK